MGIEELPQVIASDIQDAIQSDTQDSMAKMHEDEVALEKLRIKTEERINERMAERDENIAGMQTGMDEMRSMFNSLLNRFDSFMNSVAASPSIIHNEISPEDDSDEDENEDEENIPPVASEDIVPDENPEVLSAVDDIPDEVKHPVETVENAEEEIVDGNKSTKRGRRKRGRR